MGLTCPKNSSGGEAGVNDDWASCVIQIGDLTGLSSDERRLVFAHEIGHALKVSHISPNTIPSVMFSSEDPNVGGCAEPDEANFVEPTYYDLLRLKFKLDGMDWLL